jgi:hypothetical protein
MYLNSGSQMFIMKKMSQIFYHVFQTASVLFSIRELKVPEFVFRSVVLHLHKKNNEI